MRAGAMRARCLTAVGSSPARGGSTTTRSGLPLYLLEEMLDFHRAYFDGARLLHV